jgi:hypothetical protein
MHTYLKWEIFEYKILRYNNWDVVKILLLFKSWSNLIRKIIILFEMKNRPPARGARKPIERPGLTTDEVEELK